LQQAGLDALVAMFTLAVALASAVIFGVAPALHIPRAEIMMGKEQMSVRQSGSLRQILVVAEIAISIILLGSAGPLLRSLWKLQNAPTGMETENVLTEAISLGSQSYREASQQFTFFTELETRLIRLPGVTSLAISDSVPPAGPMRSTILAGIEVSGRAPFAEGSMVLRAPAGILVVRSSGARSGGVGVGNLYACGGSAGCCVDSGATGDAR
jgi:putative ABC transport system permease protein